MNARGLLLLVSFLSARSATGAQSPAWTQLPNSPVVSRHDDVYPLNESLAWTASGRDGIFKTSDAGVTWKKVFTNAATHFRCIAFASATRGWAGNLGPGSYDTGVTDPNVMYETFDGGQTWTNRPGFA